MEVPSLEAQHLLKEVAQQRLLRFSLQLRLRFPARVRSLRAYPLKLFVEFLCSYGELALSGGHLGAAAHVLDVALHHKPVRRAVATQLHFEALVERILDSGALFARVSARRSVAVQTFKDCLVDVGKLFGHKLDG